MNMFEVAAGYTTDGLNITTSLRVVPAESATDATAGFIPPWWTITYADDAVIVAESQDGFLWFQCNPATPFDAYAL